MSVFSKAIYELEPTAFGLDITDTKIRAVSLSRSNTKEPFLAGYAQADTPDGAVIEGAIQAIAEDKLVGVIKDLKKHTKFGALGTKFVVVGIPEQHVFMKVFSIPKMKHEEIGGALRWEIEGNIPVSMDEAYIDWEIIDGPKDAQDHIDVLVAAVPKDIVDAYSRVVKKAGFILKAVETESMASARSLVPRATASKPVLIVDIGAHHANLVVFSGTAIRFTSSVAFGGALLTQAINKDMAISFDEAEKLKQEHGIDKSKLEGKLFRTINPLLENFVSEVKKYLAFYKAHTFHEHGSPHTISKILLSGGGANLKGLPAYLGAMLKFDVELGNPWVNVGGMSIKDFPVLPFDKSLSFSKAIGLSLRGLPNT